GATSISGDPLDAATFEHCLRRDPTLVHLVGTRHPDPSKANEFERIDLVSIKASVDAARRHRTAGLCQRRAARARHARLRGCSSGRRGSNRRSKAHRDDPASVVRDRAGPSLADPAEAALLDLGAAAAYMRHRATPWSLDARAN